MSGISNSNRFAEASRLIGAIQGHLGAVPDIDADDAIAKYVSDHNKRANDGRHKENRELRADALAYFIEHRKFFASKDKTAAFISANIVPRARGGCRQVHHSGLPMTINRLAVDCERHNTLSNGAAGLALAAICLSTARAFDSTSVGPTRPADGVAGSALTVDHYTIDSGGGASTGGVFEIKGTIAQPDTDPLQPSSGGAFAGTGGFWGGRDAHGEPAWSALCERVRVSGVGCVGNPGTDPGRP